MPQSPILNSRHGSSKPTEIDTIDELMMLLRPVVFQLPLFKSSFMGAVHDLVGQGAGGQGVIDTQDATDATGVIGGAGEVVGGEGLGTQVVAYQ